MLIIIVQWLRARGQLVNNGGHLSKRLIKPVL